MYKYEVLIKSGTLNFICGAGCDVQIAEVETPFLPRIGETISINKKDDNGKCAYIDYLVRDIKYWINGNRNGIYLYVIQI